MNHKDILRAFRRTSPVLNWILLISIVFLVTSNLIEKSEILDYVKISPIFPGSNQIIFSSWEIFKRVCVAIPTSYTFFFFSNRIPESLRQARIHASINPRLKSIVRSIRGVYEEVVGTQYSTDNMTLKEILSTTDLKELESVVNNLELFGDSKRASLTRSRSGTFVYESWIEVISIENNNSATEIEKVLRLTPFLDADLILCLTNIESSSFFKIVNYLAYIYRTGGAFSGNAGLGKLFVEHLYLCSEIESYISKAEL